MSDYDLFCKWDISDEFELRPALFIAYAIQCAEEKLDNIEAALDDHQYSDDDWIAAMQMNSFLLIKFLLIVIQKHVRNDYCDRAAKSLAFMGNIHGINLYRNLIKAWDSEPSTADSDRHLLWTATERMADRVQNILAAPRAPRRVSTRYMGFDPRDLQEYHMNDDPEFEEEDKALREQEERDLAMQTNISVWLLVISQVFARPLPSVAELITLHINEHKKKRESGKIKTEESALDAATAEIQSQTVFTKLGESVSHFAEEDPGEYHHDYPDEEEEDDLKFDIMSILRDGIVKKLLELVQSLPEDSFLPTMRIVASINAQFPKTGERISSEIAAMFIEMESDGLIGMNASQGFLNILNDVGYPRCTRLPETIPAIKMCTDMIYYQPSHQFGSDTDNEHRTMEERENRYVGLGGGYFSTNDIKVIVEIIIRELRNMPLNNTSDDLNSSSSSSTEAGIKTEGISNNGEIASLAEIRLMYLLFLEAIISTTTWSTAGQRHMREDIAALLDDCIQNIQTDNTPHSSQNNTSNDGNAVLTSATSADSSSGESATGEDWIDAQSAPLLCKQCAYHILCEYGDHFE